jgi:histidine ammonia-lyase
VLTAAGISGRESNALHAAAGRVPAEMIIRSRDYDEHQWRHYQDRLAQRGLLDGEGALTDAGRELKMHIENTTDATRGEPLAMRAQKRKVELEQALENLPTEDMRARNDIDVALATINALLTGNVDRLSDSTAAELSRILESSKHIAVVAPSKSP